ncbi:polysaccharide deacetylase family protein [Streptomyces sp. SHP 1-2]|uniref:polysaccharide deacetylase family protein n=1 Tax=Streptomyces sp. SHP 1-2 TaxID=2769489 RepID=UPI00223718EB|nr:polysaccharide deacetylase family protein [Streptomyces sp. SHP 1-2]MCW5250712.1 polysaccharide deacetylase family protein [Streptomyces sp. SHP 1-2]
MPRIRRTLTALAPLLLAAGLAAPAQADDVAAAPAPAAATAAWPAPAPVLTRVATGDPVLFITIDDGWGTEDAAGAQRLLIERRIPASLFLLPDAYERDRDYYRTLLAHSPARVENHTVTHRDMTTLTEAEQRGEICGARDRQLAAFGDSPQLFRPAGGQTYQWPYYNDATRTAATACGARTVVTWTHDLTTWGAWSPPVPALSAGDIVLLHMGPQLEGDLRRVLAAADAAGLSPARLRDYTRGAS